MLFEAVPTVEEALAEAEKVIGNDYNIILMPEGSLTVPLSSKLKDNRFKISNFNLYFYNLCLYLKTITNIFMQESIA